MKNPFVFLFESPKSLTRLTDINTEEVSIVDKAANKRRFAIIKSENVMTKPVDVTQFLEGLTNSLEKLTTLTEVVKAKVDKAEDATMQESVDFKTSVEAFLNEVSGSMSSIFSEDWNPNPTPTGMAAEVAAQTVGTANPAGEAAGGEAKVQADSVRSEVEGQLPEGDVGAKGAQGAAAGGEALEQKDTMRAETESVMVTGTTVLTDGEEKATETNSAGSVQVHKATPAGIAEISKTLLDLATTVPTLDAVEKAFGMTEGLFFSGGINVDAYDIEALAAVVNAICESMYDGESEETVRKSADRILADVSKRVATISKRVTKANAVSASDGKELKIASMILKAVYDGMKPKKDDKDDKKDKKKDKKGDKKDDMKKDDGVTTGGITLEDLNKAVSDAIAKAVAPLVAENQKLTAQVAVAKAETEKVVKDYNALNTTQTRVSSSETVTATETESSVVHPNSLGIADYNAKAV